MKKTIPFKVQVGPYRYSIKIVNPNQLPELSDYGAADHHTLEIRLREGLCADQMKVTLLHEIMHCCSRVKFDYSTASDVSEETWISFTSPTLYGTIRDNPIVRKFLFGD
jgi:hypothetical protein